MGWVRVGTCRYGALSAKPALAPPVAWCRERAEREKEREILKGGMIWWLKESKG